MEEYYEQRGEARKRVKEQDHELFVLRNTVTQLDSAAAFRDTELACIRRDLEVHYTEAGSSLGELQGELDAERRRVVYLEERLQEEGGDFDERIAQLVNRYL